MDVIYRLDGIDFNTFGVKVSGSKGIISRPKPKNKITQNWETYHGVCVDLSSVYYEPREIELDCFIEASNYGDFIQKFNAFTALFDTPNSKRLEVSMSVEDDGRNLALNSAVEVSNSYYNTYNYSLSQDLVTGETYTATIWGNLYSGKSLFYLWMGGGYTICGQFQKVKDGIYTLTFVGPTTVSGNGLRNQVNVYAEPDSVVGVSTIDKFKLEKGNKATDWTPAPEDIAPLPFEVYLVDDIDPKKVWNNSKMVAEFDLKLREPEPIKKVISYTRTGEADKTVSITVNTPKLLNIYWGDGTHTYDVLGSQTITHNYSNNGTFYIVVSGSIDEIVSLTTTGAIVWNKL